MRRVQIEARVTAASRRIVARARATRRALLSYMLALSTSPEPHGENNSLAVRASHVVPFARPLRQWIRRRPGHRDLDVQLLVLGAQGGKEAGAFAQAAGTLAFGSLPMEAGPHVTLLRAALASGGQLSDEQIRSSSYWGFAKQVTRVAGGWFGARDDDELLRVSRNFVEWALGDCERVTNDGGSPFDDSILVARLSGSPVFQIIDGHHRVARAIARGERTVKVHRTWLDNESPLQQRLELLSGGTRTMRQPVPAREVESGWVVTTNCADRLLRIVRFLERDLDAPASATYLDVGAGYGWYLGEMRRFGLQVLGIEPDVRAVSIGTSFYGLTDGDFVVGEATASVEDLAGPYDVVSCFGLRALLQGCGTQLETTRLIKGLDRISGRVLFVDSDDRPDGRTSGADEDPSATSLTSLILANTSFRQVIDLGSNHDPIGPWSVGSGSRLLAFVR